MEDCDPLAEARAEAADRLRRERDLRNEHDRAVTAFEGDGAGPEVDLGLPASRRSEEQEVGAHLGVERADDAIERRTLCRAQLGRLCLTGQTVALRRLRPLTASLPLHGSDERERTARRRPVVL